MTSSELDISFFNTLNNLTDNPKLHKSLLSLNDFERKILNLLFIENWEIKEIAKSLTKTEFSIYSAKNRILKKLKNALLK